MSTKSLWSKIATIFSGSIITLIIGFVTAPIITRMVDPLEYGKLSFFTMYTSILSLLLSLGLDRAYLRFYYDTDSNKRTILLFDCIKYPVVAFLISIPIILLLGHSANSADISNIDIVLTIFIINLFVVIMDRFALNVLRIQQRSIAYATCTIVSKVIYVLSAIILIFTTKQDHFIILIFSTMIASAITFLTALVISRSEWNFKNKISMVRQYSRWDLFMYGFPIMIQGMVSIVFQSTDKIMLKHFGTYSDVGVYSSALYYINLLTVFSNSINTIIGPEMYKYHSENPEGTEFYEKVNRLMTFLMFFLGISVIFAKDILVLVLGEKYREAAMIMPFLVFNPIMTSIAGINSISIEIKKESKYFLIITIISSLFNVIGNYFLIPLVGAKGAAISTGVSFIIYYMITTIISNKLYKFDFGIKGFCIMTSITLIFALYNTWNKINIISIIMYCFSIILLTICYYQQVVYLYSKVKSFLTKGRE